MQNQKTSRAIKTHIGEKTEILKSENMMVMPRKGSHAFFLGRSDTNITEPWNFQNALYRVARVVGLLSYCVLVIKL